MVADGSEMRGAAERLLRPLIILIALHSFAVGAMLTFAPAWSARFAGWPATGPLFFLRQGGVFHLILAACYLYEQFRYRGVFILVLAKSVAMVFLLTLSFSAAVPWAVPFSGVTDGAMGAAVYLLDRVVRRGRVS